MYNTGSLLIRFTLLFAFHKLESVTIKWYTAGEKARRNGGIGVSKKNLLFAVVRLFECVCVCVSACTRVGKDDLHIIAQKDYCRGKLRKVLVEEYFEPFVWFSLCAYVEKKKHEIGHLVNRATSNSLLISWGTALPRDDLCPERVEK
ncbi:MAG: hypothetical protein JOS17DRAFT_37336 [Linnemannia elongata]|nr:MAG: hypothetical protein JOS17DRAFT_37336 [Linnemannia elongata]